MLNFFFKLDTIEKKIDEHPLIKYRGRCEPPEDDPFFCQWDRFYAMASLMCSATTAALVGASVKGIWTALEFQKLAEQEYNKICTGEGHWGLEFAAFLAQGQSSHICSDLQRRKEDAMQGLIQWLWAGAKSGAALGITGLIAELSSGVSRFASILRKAHCRRINHDDGRFCVPHGVPVADVVIDKK